MKTHKAFVLETKNSNVTFVLQVLLQEKTCWCMQYLFINKKTWWNTILCVKAWLLYAVSLRKVKRFKFHSIAFIFLIAHFTQTLSKKGLFHWLSILFMIWNVFFVKSPGTIRLNFIVSNVSFVQPHGIVRIEIVYFELQQGLSTFWRHLSML